MVLCFVTILSCKQVFYENEEEGLNIYLEAIMYAATTLKAMQEKIGQEQGGVKADLRILDQGRTFMVNMTEDLPSRINILLGL